MSEASESPRRRKRKKHQPVKMPWWMLYPLVLGSVAGVVYFFRRNDPVAAGVVVVSLSAALLGFRMGVSTIVISLAGLGVAYWLAPPWGIRIEDRFAGLFGTSGFTNRCLAVGTVGLVVSLLIATVASMLIGGLMARRRRVDVLDRYFGLVAAVSEGLFVVLLVLAAIDRFDLGNRLGVAAAEKVAGALDKSAVLPYVKQLDPFARLPILNRVGELQTSIQYLREPQNVNALLRDPRVDDLRRDPAYQSAIRELRNDPVVSDFFDRGETLDRATMIRLMNSDALLELLDQAEFLDRASEVLREKVAAP
ncbi:MAG: CvpA family protein [Planctomycetota bacterium]